jgi:transposase
MSDAKTLKGFLERMKKYGAGTIRTLLDRGFYSASNISALLKGGIGFYIPVPANIKWAQDLIDECRDAVEMPEHIIPVNEGDRKALYGMTVLGKQDWKRVWRHAYYDAARRSDHIESLFSSLQTWEHELISGEAKKANQWAYDEYFTVKTTPKRGLSVKRNQAAINEYKKDRAGYWIILTNCEKDAAKALEAYRGRSLVESQFDDMKNDLSLSRVRTHNPDTMRGRALVQFLALIVSAQIRVMLAKAWENRYEIPKDDRLARYYSLAELMMRLGTYRQTVFSGRYGKIISTPTKAQRSIFLAYGIEVCW